MRKIFILSAVFAFSFLGCDKVDNAYPKNTTGLDPALYPGDFNNYTFPTFSTNSNTERNVLIEDFTGHKCTFCPAAADLAHSLETTYPERIFVSTIHSGPDGKGVFQVTSNPNYTYDFTNAIGLQIGKYFGGIAGNGFTGNPCGNISRVPNTQSQVSFGPADWSQKTTDLINTNDLKINLQAEINYFPSTSGAFIHVEVDPIQSVANELRLVVAFYEDSIVKPQTFPNNVTDYTYVHRDLLKLHVNGDMFGQKISNEYLNANGKYYFNYSLKIPAEYTAENSHLLIYVFDRVTNEIYQVIKKKFI